MANLWIYASVGLDTIPPLHGEAIAYPDDAVVSVTVTPQIGYIYDYCTVFRETIPPTRYSVYTSSITVTMDVRTTMTFVGHAEGEPPPPPPPDGNGVNPLLFVVPLAVAAGLLVVIHFI